MNKLSLIAGVLALVVGQTVVAAETSPATGVSKSTAEIETGVLAKKAADNLEQTATSDVSKELPIDQQVEELVELVKVKMPGMPIESVAATPFDGVFEIITEGQIYYINNEASFLLTGNMIDLETQQNMTESRLGGLHMDMLAAIDEKNMLIYEPEEASDRSVTVFTDISCGYCRLLHEQIDTLLDAGVRVRYLMFPRAGLNSPGHQALESVWCSDDPQNAMTVAKAGGQVEERSCANPIESHVEIAQQVGLRGTPLIYLDTGERVHGYREAAVLAKMINDGTPYASSVSDLVK